MFIGEFGALSATQQTCAALDAYSYMYHVQSIGLTPYPPTIGTELENEGCALSFYNKVGTRIEIQGATISGSATPAGKLNFAVTLVNTGTNIARTAATRALNVPCLSDRPRPSKKFFNPACADAAVPDFRPASNGARSRRLKARKNTSSATPTRATAAHSPTA